MVLLSPSKGESQNDFVSRCMGNATMRKEFPNQKQRNAVCFSQFRKAKGGESMSKVVNQLPFKFTEKFQVIQEGKGIRNDNNKNIRKP